MTSSDLVSTALALKGKTHYRLVRVDWQGGLYWLKQPDAKPKKHHWRGVQNLAARMLGVDMLRATARAGNAADLKVEEDRLRRWHALDLPAPSILASGDGWFLMANDGTILPKAIKNMSPESRADTLRRALDILLAAHALSEYHGRPMIKDMLLSGNGDIIFIDLEETPVDVMPLATAQARDLLVFLSSLPDDDGLVTQLTQRALANTTPEVRRELTRMARLSRPLRRLLALFTSAESRRRHRLDKAYALALALENTLFS